MLGKMVHFWLAGAEVSSRPVPPVRLLAMRAFEATGLLLWSPAAAGCCCPAAAACCCLPLLLAAARCRCPAAAACRCLVPDAWCLSPSAPLGAAWCCLLLLPAGCLGLPPAVACAPSLSPRAALCLSPISDPLISYI